MSVNGAFVVCVCVSIQTRNTEEEGVLFGTFETLKVVFPFLFVSLSFFLLMIEEPTPNKDALSDVKTISRQDNRVQCFHCLEERSIPFIGRSAVLQQQQK